MKYGNTKTGLRQMEWVDRLSMMLLVAVISVAVPPVSLDKIAGERKGRSVWWCHTLTLGKSRIE